jgi:hypothetical protein
MEIKENVTNNTSVEQSEHLAKSANQTITDPKTAQKKQTVTFKLSDRTVKEIREGAKKLSISGSEYVTFAIRCLYGGYEKKRIDEEIKKIRDIKEMLI